MSIELLPRMEKEEFKELGVKAYGDVLRLYKVGIINRPGVAGAVV